MSGILGFLGTAGVAAGCVLASRTLTHYFQLESYQFQGYFRALKRSWKRLGRNGLVLAAPLIPLALLCGLISGSAGRFLSGWPAANTWVCLILGLTTAGLGWALRWWDSLRREKKPLVITPRVKRLTGIMAAVYLLLALLLRAIWPVWGLYLFPLLLPLWFAAAALAAWPVEKLINELYFRDAQKILASRPDLIRVGITGSYGKTSVKFILGAMLSEKYQTLVTPASFNTPMGLTRVIRTQLRPGHQVFVAEMGARHRGDIRELCRLVHPTYGLLTSVGPQHLDTFRNIENIRETKYDLIRALPTDGCAFFPDDGGICAELYDRTDKPKRLVSLNRGKAGHTPDVWAEGIRVSDRGSSFRLCTPSGSVACETRLLGSHNIGNLLLAASAALTMGVSLEQIRRAVRRLEPVEHRLQLLNQPGGITVIDDAFNSNPKSCMAALEVLAGMGGRRILITPGLVELGEKEAEYNRSFGEAMKGCCDTVILVGEKHTAPIREGLEKTGFDPAQIHVTADLNAATALMRSIVRPGDTVMFENDLPDNYSE
ncbi:MAG: UDP-N-acetylmuramoyl-tripeptide--D-alanyl-D-alanine ligase [Clostridia bacterium]|nr:UDP-N-acetylmuramoyl-tripeptide--D-alanyl-D-alanine ligase [Clostridia bacterium]